MLRRATLIAGALLFVFAAPSVFASTVSFSALDIATTMAASGAPLSNGTYQWGLWAVRAMPIVGGTGLYTIDAGSGSGTQTGWGASTPNGAFGAAPYTPANHAWFWDASGSEAGSTAANPLYMIMDKPANTFVSYTFDGSGAFVGSAPPIYLPGYDGGFGGTNIVTAVGSSSMFSFDFTLGSGATWDGMWQFVVDGSKYTAGTESSPGAWVEDFFGGYTLSGGTPGGGLTGNMGAGYLVTPEPASLILLGSGLLGLAARRRNRRHPK